jgi:hypothetical protein
MVGSRRGQRRSTEIVLSCRVDALECTGDVYDARSYNLRVHPLDRGRGSLTRSSRKRVEHAGVGALARAEAAMLGREHVVVVTAQAGAGGQAPGRPEALVCSVSRVMGAQRSARGLRWTHVCAVVILIMVMVVFSRMEAGGAHAVPRRFTCRHATPACTMHLDVMPAPVTLV